MYTLRTNVSVKFMLFMFNSILKYVYQNTRTCHVMVILLTASMTKVNNKFKNLICRKVSFSKSRHNLLINSACLHIVLRSQLFMYYFNNVLR